MVGAQPFAVGSSIVWRSRPDGAVGYVVGCHVLLDSPEMNLEQPWRRTPVGFDSRDDVLDITVSDDLNEWQLKDLDELAFTVHVGMFTPEEGRSIHAAADTAIADIADRRWPFDESAWNQVLPAHLVQPTTLPAGWDAP